MLRFSNNEETYTNISDAKRILDNEICILYHKLWNYINRIRKGENSYYSGFLATVENIDDFSCYAARIITGHILGSYQITSREELTKYLSNGFSSFICMGAFERDSEGNYHVFDENGIFGIKFLNLFNITANNDVRYYYPNAELGKANAFFETLKSELTSRSDEELDTIVKLSSISFFKRIFEQKKVEYISKKHNADEYPEDKLSKCEKHGYDICGKLLEYLDGLTEKPKQIKLGTRNW